jgi:hypothetical protein
LSWILNIYRYQNYITARRLERIIKEALEELSDNKEILKKLLTGRRVQLAEELSK